VTAPAPGVQVRVMRAGQEVAAVTVRCVVDGIDGLHTVLAIDDHLGDERTFVIHGYGLAAPGRWVAYATPATTPAGAEP